MTTVVALTAVHASLADIAPRHRRAPLQKTFTACPDALDTCFRLGEMNEGIKWLCALADTQHLESRRGNLIFSCRFDYFYRYNLAAADFISKK